MGSKVKPKQKISKITATFLALIFCAVFVHAVKFVFYYLKKTASQQTALARVKGNPKAPLHIVEYLDFECPACAKGALLLKNYLEKYPSKIYLEVKYFPLSNIHQYALKSAAYAECAARQNRFWPYYDLLVKKQSQWKRSLYGDTMFQKIAKQMQLNLNTLQSCLENEETKAFILADKNEGASRGVKSTPTYFINGKMVVGVKPLETELTAFFTKENK